MLLVAPWQNATGFLVIPVIAQLVEHLTVEIRSDQMVPGSIPGDRTLSQRRYWQFPRKVHTSAVLVGVV